MYITGKANKSPSTRRTNRHRQSRREIARIKGWMGRAHQATKARGLFVHPIQIEEIKRHNEIGAARMVVSRDAQGTTKWF